MFWEPFFFLWEQLVHLLRESIFRSLCYDLINIVNILGLILFSKTTQYPIRLCDKKHKLFWHLLQCVLAVLYCAINWVFCGSSSFRSVFDMFWWTANVKYLMQGQPSVSTLKCFFFSGANMFCDLRSILLISKVRISLISTPRYSYLFWQDACLLWLLAWGELKMMPLS